MDLEAYFKKQSGKIDAALTARLPRPGDAPAELSRAMRYAVLSGGKRIRPVFTLAACEAVGGREKDVMDAACALEMIHSYSLVHDDLPCMDNDLVRRGKPSCHAKFGEVTALLAGDALLTRAFGVLSASDGGGTPPERKKLTVLHWIAEAVGHRGMVGGQALDMQYQDRELDLPTVEYINTHKSGALIAVSLRAGAFLGGGTPAQVESLYRYGKAVGLLFQLTDDIMDGQGYAKVIGLRDARQEASRLAVTAKKALAPLRSRAKTLSAIADFVASRKN